MNKKLLLVGALGLSSMVAFAGDYLTNTNQTASFLRMPAQEGYISVEGAYYNPGGIGFLPDGWHFALNNQSAFQTRTAESTFGLYAYGLHNEGTTKKFKGKATAPILPALDVAYVNGRWSGSFHAGIIGGGGKCEFEDGLGSFEGVVSAFPMVMQMGAPVLGLGNFPASQYSMDTYMRGKQFFVGAQFGVGYKVLPELNVSLGGRLVYAKSNYYGYVKDIALTLGDSYTTVDPQGNAVTLPAGTQLGMTQLLGGVAQARPDLAQQVAALSNLATEVEVNCDQYDWGFAPVIGVDYKKGPLTLGLRYEFKTRLRLKNESTTTAEQAALMHNLAEFEDGKKVACDIPALLGAGVGYEFTPQLRAYLSGHYFFDKQAHQFEHKEKLLKANTWEVLAGVEYDIDDQWTVSLGGQSTNYGLGKEKKYISDISFVSSSYSLGAGVKFHVTENIGINLAYFKTFYHSTRKVQQDYNGLGRTAQGLMAVAQGAGLLDAQTAQAAQAAVGQYVENGLFRGNDRLDRTNDVIGIGLDIAF